MAELLLRINILRLSANSIHDAGKLLVEIILFILIENRVTFNTDP